MSKTVLVGAKESASWLSCKSIGHNIIQAYRYNLEEHDQFDIYLQEGEYSYIDLAKQVVKKRYANIVIVDYRIDPVLLAKKIKQIKKSKVKINIIVHVYGDFTLNLKWWKDVEQVGEIIKFKFVAASEAQKKVVESLLGLEDTECVKWIPFPVNTNEYNFKNISRNRVLKKFKIDSRKKIFIYAGRISAQKNIIEMIHYFKEYNKCIGGSAVLVLCGPIDDLGVPYLAKLPVPLSYANKFAQLIDEKEIVYLGNKDQKELADLYRCADIYLSLSTHNDEDYGMSPAEALCCGTSCILSAWGGYRSFKKLLPGFVSTVPVEKISGRYNVSMKKALVQLLSSEKIQSNPEEIAQKGMETLGYMQIGMRYVDFIKKRNKHGTIVLPQHTKVVIEGIENHFHKTFVKANIEVTYNNLYHQIYRGYYE